MVAGALVVAPPVAPVAAPAGESSPRISRTADEAGDDAPRARLAPEPQLRKMRALTVGSVGFLAVVGLGCIAWAIRERRRSGTPEA